MKITFFVAALATVAMAMPVIERSAEPGSTIYTPCRIHGCKREAAPVPEPVVERSAPKVKPPANQPCKVHGCKREALPESEPITERSAPKAKPQPPANQPCKVHGCKREAAPEPAQKPAPKGPPARDQPCMIHGC